MEDDTIPEIEDAAAVTKTETDAAIYVASRRHEASRYDDRGKIHLQRDSSLSFVTRRTLSATRSQTRLPFEDFFIARLRSFSGMSIVNLHERKTRESVG